MSNIEEKFFEAFEIEPKRSIGLIKIKEPSYPQITDRILLELICIANHEDVYIELEGTDVETMKNNLLENFIHFKRIIPKEQIQSIFKEMLNV